MAHFHHFLVELLVIKYNYIQVQYISQIGIYIKALEGVLCFFCLSLKCLASEEARQSRNGTSTWHNNLDTLASDEARPLNIVFTYSIHIFRYASLRRGQTKYVATINVESLIQIRQPQTRLDQHRFQMLKNSLKFRYASLRRGQTIYYNVICQRSEYLDTLASDEARQEDVKHWHKEAKDLDTLASDEARLFILR